MTEINSSTIIGNIALELTKQGITEIFIDKFLGYIDQLRKELNKSDYTTNIEKYDIMVFVYSYSFLCDFADSKIIFKYTNDVPAIFKLESYFKNDIPTALQEAIKKLTIIGDFKNDM